MTTITTSDLTGLLNDINTVDDVVESQQPTTTSKLGTTIRTLNGLAGEFESSISTFEADAESRISTAVASAGYQIVGDFSDVTKVQITAKNQVYTSQVVTNLEDAVWRYIGALPYTPTGSDPTQAPEAGNWQAVAIGELKSIARSLNVADSAVIYSTDTVTPIPAYIYDAPTQTTLRVPTLNGTGETITSFFDSTLNTSGGSYTIYTKEKEDLRLKGDLLGWIGAYNDGVDYSAEVAEWASSQLPIKSADGIVKCGAFSFASDCVVNLTPKTVFVDNGLLGVNDRSIDLSGKKNIIINANGAALNHNGVYTSGEQRHVIVIGDSSESIEVNNFNALNAGGDGFYVGTPSTFNAPPRNITLNNCASLYSRRQGLSVTNVDGLIVNGGAYKFTGKGAAGSTFPAAGIDIEPNSETALIKGVVINSPDLRGNEQKGAEVALFESSSTSEELDVLIDSPLLDGNGFGLKIRNCESGVKGKVIIRNPKITAPAWTFVEILDWSATGVSVEIDSPICEDINPDNSTSTEFAASTLIKVYNKTNDTTVGGLTVRNIHCKNSPNIATLFRFIQEGTAGFDNVLLDDQDMLAVDEHIKVIDFQSFANISTNFTRWRERTVSANQDENAGLELGSIITNSGFSGDSTVRLSTALVDAIGGNIIRFENRTDDVMTIFTDATGALILPVQYQTTTTRTTSLNARGDSVDLYCDKDNRYWIVKNPVIT